MSWLTIAPDMLKVRDLAVDISGQDMLPEPKNVFRAFTYFQPQDTRVVIVGQDPYNSVDEQGNTKAYGLSFGYNPKYTGLPNSSLQNIINELGAGKGFDTSLVSWARQGVLMINTCLSVHKDKPMSHGDLGWQEEVEKVLKYLHDYTDTIYIGWGSEAAKVLKFVDEDRKVLTSHPCNRSHNRGKVPFTGSKWHEKANSKLGRTKIKWR